MLGDEYYSPREIEQRMLDQEREEIEYKMKKTKEVQEIEQDHEYWLVIERLLGWRLFGFTYKHTASYDREGVTVNLTGTMRDDIVTAILQETRART